MFDKPYTTNFKTQSSTNNLITRLPTLALISKIQVPDNWVIYLIQDGGVMFYYPV